jgi:hypothetical protein
MIEDIEKAVVQLCFIAIGRLCFDVKWPKVNRCSGGNQRWCRVARSREAISFPIVRRGAERFSGKQARARWNAGAVRPSAAPAAARNVTSRYGLPPGKSASRQTPEKSANKKYMQIHPLLYRRAD